MYTIYWYTTVSHLVSYSEISLRMKYKTNKLNQCHCEIGGRKVANGDTALFQDQFSCACVHTVALSKNKAR